MSTTDLAPRPALKADEVLTGDVEPVVAAEPDPHDENIDKLSPCPFCGANAAEAPEGVHDGQTGPAGRPRWHFSHCWRCGFDHRRPANALAVMGPSMLPLANTKEIAAQIATQVHAALGLPEGQTLADVLAAIRAAPQPAVVTAPAVNAPMPSATEIASEMLRLQREAEASAAPAAEAAQPGGEAS